MKTIKSKRTDTSKRKRLNKRRLLLSNQKKIVSMSNIRKNPSKLRKYSNYKNHNKRKTKDNQKKQLLHFILAHRSNRQSHKAIKDILKQDSNLRRGNKSGRKMNKSVVVSTSKPTFTVIRKKMF
jgi:hypothetical protein